VTVEDIGPIVGGLLLLRSRTRNTCGGLRFLYGVRAWARGRRTLTHAVDRRRGQQSDPDKCRNDKGPIPQPVVSIHARLTAV